VQAWPGVVVVSGPALRVAGEAILIAMRSRHRSGLPNSRIHEDLVRALLQASANGHSDVPDVHIPATSPTVPIDEAAKQLGLSHRQTRRLAPKLGGRIIAGRWLLDQTAIDEHKEPETWTEPN